MNAVEMKNSIMIRTVSEEPCIDCGKITNAYEPQMGRFCPQCCAKRCAACGKNLALQHDYRRIFEAFYYPEDMKYLAKANKQLLIEPLIDHRKDIDGV